MDLVHALDNGTRLRLPARRSGLAVSLRELSVFYLYSIINNNTAVSRANRERPKAAFPERFRQRP